MDELIKVKDVGSDIIVWVNKKEFESTTHRPEYRIWGQVKLTSENGWYFVRGDLNEIKD